MPNKKSVNSGGGAKPVEKKTSFALDPVPTGGVDTNSATHPEAVNDHPLGHDKSPLSNHVNPNTTAHQASEISIDGNPSDTFTSHNVEGALDELSALIPPKPPRIGFARDYMNITGYPDWGVLKLRDSSLLWREPSSFLNSGNLPSQVYPYYFHPPHPAQAYKPFLPDGDLIDYVYPSAWSEGGDDPKTDPTFNVFDALYSGGGDGKVFSGVFTRDPDGNPVTANTGHESLRIYPTNGGNILSVVLSGMVHPADRGVLALFHFPFGGDITDFVADNLEDKVVCAILLGQGILDASTCPCDGDLGGIFLSGTDSSGDYDPYEFPGQATGQGDLSEIHTGLISGTNDVHDSTSSYYNFDDRASDTFTIVSSTATTTPTYTTSTNHTFSIGDIVTVSGHSVGTADGHREVTGITANTFDVSAIGGGATGLGGGTGGTVVREVGCNEADYIDYPYPAQVRLGSHDSAGVSLISGGIPILGATSTVRGGGDDNNFFRYRLPYLDEYSSGNSRSLKWTPSAEHFRFYEKPAISDNPSSDLASAGDYQNYTKDYFPFQVARYRHRFELDVTNYPSNVNNGYDIGSFILIHFKREKFFEDFVVNGTVPSADQIYTASLSDFTNVENLDNLALNATPTGVASSYHTIRTNIFAETTAGVAVPSTSNRDFVVVRTVDRNVYVSGVAYFTPENNWFSVGDLSTNISDLFENTYKYVDSNGTVLNMSRPLFYSFSAFAWQDINLTSTLGEERRQRVEVSLDDLGYTLADAPLITDTASVSMDVTFDGDDTDPSFSADARSRLFFRRPIGHEDPSTTILPFEGLSVPSSDGKTLLYHSSLSTGVFGNYQAGGGKAETNVVTPTKNSSERFLDEIYRYDSNFTAISASDPSYAQRLTGPGLPLGGEVIGLDIPVEIGLENNGTAPELWADVSWIQQSLFLNSLVGTNELQVGGMPHRNPPLTEGVINPVPSHGILMYPKEDYTTGHRPSTVDGDIVAFTQPDYSSETGTKQYVRVFDLGESYIGKSVVTLKIKGLQLKDFAYTPTSSGGSDNIGIFIKVAGLTTWLDIGRRDGDGASKQDPLLDGAGCQVIGTGTFDAIDSEDGYVYCEVKVNVGSSANFYETSFSEVPLMLKVVFYDTATARYYDFAHEIDPITEIPTSTVNANANTRDVRGLIGVEIK